MKKMICMMLAALMLLFSAAGAEEALTMRQVMEANKAEKLVEHYGSVHILVKNGDDMWERYMSPEAYYYGDTQKTELYQGPLYYACERNRYAAQLYAGAEQDLSAFDFIFFSEDYIDLEEILYQEEREGVISLKTQLHLSSVNPGLVAPGNFLVVEYVLDAETLAVLSLSEKLRFDNGQSLKTDAVIMFEYGAETPESVQAMLDRLSGEDVCEISVVLNPGEGEETVSAAIAKGDGVEIVVPEGYALYADEGCTKKWKGSKADGDMTVYAAK